MNTPHSLLPFVAFALAAGAAAQTVTVTTTADAIDVDSFNGTVADLPGPDGEVSLSEAMIATNNTPGHQTVAFAIPADELGWIGPTYDGIAVFHTVTGFYWRANDEVTIDGTTQTAFGEDTNPSGNEILLYSNTFYLNDDDSTLRGFHSTSIQASGSNSLIEDNTGTMNITVFGGSGSTIQNNRCGTIKLDRSNDNVVVGNTTQRVRVLGGSPTAPITGTVVGGPSLQDRNFITGYGSYDSEGLPSGAAVQLAWTANTVIENNWIGTTTDGLASGNQACTMGINFQNGNDGVLVKDNRIAGILGIGMGPHYAGTLWGWALYFWGNTTDVQVVGNTIGLDSTGAPTLGSVRGVDVDNTSFYSADGISLVDNTIAGHILEGVRVSPSGNMRLSGNAIYANGGLAVDLIPDGFSSGVSPNDALDLDEGGSGVQNYPVLTLAANEAGMVHAAGTLASSPFDTFTIELFASSACDDSGFGQSEVFLGSTSVTTDAAGDASFDVTLPAVVPSGQVLTATATLEPLGLTSELSACLPIADAFCQTDLGFGGPGTALLSMCGGDLSGGTTADLELTGAPAGVPAVLGVSASFNPTLLFGGTVVPWPPTSVYTYVTDGSGSVTFADVPGGGGPATFYAQFAYVDGAQPFGWGFSNALQVDWLP